MGRVKSHLGNIGVAAIALAVGTALAVLPLREALAQSLTPTDELQPPYVECCKNNSSFVNLRSGPNPVFYPLVGTLTSGQLAPVMGKSSGGGWVEIQYLAVPSGVAWVSLDYVILHIGPSELPTM